MAKTRVRIVPIKDLILDDRNPNKHTERGRKALENSLKKYGAGRSVLVDKNNRVIAGNATVEEAKRAGMKKIAVIEGDGSVLVAVQRGDLDLRKDKKARALSIADNRVAEIDLQWDTEMLLEADVDLKSLGFTDAEVERMSAEVDKALQEEILDQAIQLRPMREFVVIVCDENNSEWEDLKKRLKLQLVRRGGYKKGSQFDATGTQRVIPAKQFLKIR
jgi:hypothetical protein